VPTAGSGKKHDLGIIHDWEKNRQDGTWNVKGPEANIGSSV